MRKVSSFLKISQYRWEKYWAGSWSFLTAAYFAHYYTRLMARQFGVGIPKAVIISRHGYSACYFDVNDRRRFGERRVRQVASYLPSVQAFCTSLKREADALLRFIGKLKKRTPTRDEISGYIRLFYHYTGNHITPRHVVDFLPPQRLRPFLKPLEHARLYTEKVYKQTEQFIDMLARKIGRRVGLPSKLILCLLPNEFEGLLAGRSVPKKADLQRRYAGSALLFTPKGVKVVTGRDVRAIESSLAGSRQKGEVRGTPAFPGVVRGVVRIVFDPHATVRFRPGDVLMTPMTRPEFLPLMKAAGAVVTDAGGLLSHAAITAREMKKPTVVGTGSATKMFRNGDRVEVDATKGIVRKL